MLYSQNVLCFLTTGLLSVSEKVSLAALSASLSGEFVQD